MDEDNNLCIEAYVFGSSTEMANTCYIINDPIGTTLSTVLDRALSSTKYAYDDEHIRELKTSKGTDVKGLLHLNLSSIVKAG